MNLHKAEFIRSAASQKDFIRDGRPQVTMAGRSNVGKSSVINRLLDRKNFARVGDAPGKTTQVNYFLIDKKVYFVDLPGYGYATGLPRGKSPLGTAHGGLFRRRADHRGAPHRGRPP